ncbi:MAG: hypothetical protein ABSC16_04050 [Candidatus Dormibacteria bacterium]|jgi:hypothetical protein|nr:hypothetical protein [Chloroflexota bacterium]HBV93893.1 hypothetical protein [Chloroflexota bacterium]
MTDRPFVPRRSPDDRPFQRPPFRGPAPGGRPNPEPAAAPSSVRIKDGEREVEVSGSPMFVRQVLDDLPALVARLRGEAPPTPAAIRMPAPSAEQPPAARPAVPDVPVPVVTASDAADGDGASLEAQVLAALRSSAHPLAVVGIRDRLGPGVTGQQVRRILERAGSKVVASGERPIRYRLR